MSEKLSPNPNNDPSLIDMAIELTEPANDLEPNAPISSSNFKEGVKYSADEYYTSGFHGYEKVSRKWAEGRDETSVGHIVSELTPREYDMKVKTRNHAVVRTTRPKPGGRGSSRYTATQDARHNPLSTPTLHETVITHVDSLGRATKERRSTNPRVAEAVGKLAAKNIEADKEEHREFWKEMDEAKEAEAEKAA